MAISTSTDARQLVFSVFDQAAGAFLPPFFMQTKGQALRAFMDAVSQEDHNFRKHAADFTLFHIGYFDEKKAEFNNLPAPDKMALALELLNTSPTD